MTREEKIVKTKESRVFLDAILQGIKDIPSSRETSIAVTKVQEAIMWLGMNLKALNDENPYPYSYNPTNTTIEPTADELRF